MHNIKAKCYYTLFNSDVSDCALKMLWYINKINVLIDNQKTIYSVIELERDNVKHGLVQGWFEMKILV